MDPDANLDELLTFTTTQLDSDDAKPLRPGQRGQGRARWRHPTTGEES